ncbi:MAG: hypothetical protein PWP23_2938 [Candidatus Sumerlaeota bacterium]|nr:hypothetical protein [Candidatus Sumerlaeota bacterium]
MSTVVITGASGFLGRALCERFAAGGWAVRALMRRPAESPFADARIMAFECDLPERIDASAFAGADVVIHAAYTTRVAGHQEARVVNMHGTAAVLRHARRAGAHFVFVSSCSAHAGALSFYGRSKLFIESRLDAERDLIVRPGLILGGGGLFARMSATLRASRIVPLFDGGSQPLQTVHLDDLAGAFFVLAGERQAGLHVVAEPQAIAMRVFLRALARRLGTRPLFVSVPSSCVMPLLRLAESLRLPLPIGSENLLGLRGMIRQEPSPVLAAKRIRLRPWNESLASLPSSA